MLALLFKEKNKYKVSAFFFEKLTNFALYRLVTHIFRITSGVSDFIEASKHYFGCFLHKKSAEDCKSQK
jgi:hypothetical protein